MLDFFNPLRRAILAREPNEAHRLIAALEKGYDVAVITQNGDDFHTRAGSSEVVYLHGEALKNASTLHPYEPIEIDRCHPDIHIGDKAPDGSQIRPFVIFFNEDIDRRLWKRAVDLLGMLSPQCRLFVVDPSEVHLPDGNPRSFVHYRCGGTEGVKRFCEQLRSETGE